MTSAREARAERAAREASAARDETPAERLDRNWNELLQELRVTQTGVQILFAFLLVLPFQARFSELDGVARGLYVAVVLLVTVSTVLNLAPVITHRLLYALQRKDLLMTVSDGLARWSFLTLGLALVGAVMLAIDVVIGRGSAQVVGAGVCVLLVALWVAVPLYLRRHKRDADDPGYS